MPQNIAHNDEKYKRKTKKIRDLFWNSTDKEKRKRKVRVKLSKKLFKKISQN